MADTIVWYVVIDHENTCMGDLSKVVVPSSSSVYGLAKKVKSENPNDFASVDTRKLALWKWADGLDVEAQGELDDHIRDFEHKEGVRKLRLRETLSSLQWTSEHDLLVVRIPASVARADIPDDDRYRPPLLKVPEEYRGMVIKTHNRGVFIDADLSLNKLEEAHDTPEFVVAFEGMLGRHRKVGRDAFLPFGDNPPPTGTISAQQNRKAVLDKLMGALELSEAGFNVNDEEVVHLNLLAHFDFLYLSKRNTTSKLSHEDLAKAMFIFPFACYLEASVPHSSKINYGFGTDQWPFGLLMNVEDDLFTYNPRSDFLLQKDGLPRLLVEVYSKSRGAVAQDRTRMLLQAAAVVRLANTYVNKFRIEKNFVLVAVHTNNDGQAERFILFQKKDSDEDQVFYKTEMFLLPSVSARLEFVRELYNIASLLAEEDSSDADKQIREYKRAIKEVEKKYGLEAFTSRKTATMGKEGNGSRPIKRSRVDGSGDVDDLEAHGYEVIPETFKDDGGGIWKPVVKLPPNIRNVYRTSDVKKTELIAKRIRKRSNANENENEILQYLHTNWSPSPHVIKFIDSIMTTTESWLIFPKLYTIADKLSSNGGRSLRGKIEQFGWGLIKGLAYLHENGIAHLDIKPDNLVFDSVDQLKIVDFDIAVRVKDEDEEIEGYRGTRGWTAPEVCEEGGLKLKYSAIKADRWSCGRVLLSFLKVEGNRALRTVAERLTSVNPRERPSLFDWPKWVNAAHRELDDVSRTPAMDLDGGATRRPREGVRDEGDMKAPFSKKPRIAPLGAYTFQFEQQALHSPLRLEA